MKRVILPLAFAFKFSPFLNDSTNLDVEELVAETCFDKADKSTADSEGTHAEKHDAFLKAYDKCTAEQEAN